MTAIQNNFVIEVRGLTFSWHRENLVLDIGDLCVSEGERVFLHGPSGSGKSTLLGVLSGVLLPDSGVVTVLGENLTAMRSAQRDQFRVQHIGIIFQMFNLLPYLSLIENVTLPCQFSRARHQRIAQGNSTPDEEAWRLLTRLQMPADAMTGRTVSELSVGQQQRVAAARALIGGPEVIIADEPTSSLDADARAKFIDLLSEECSKSNTTLLFVSHDLALADQFDRVVDLSQINRAHPEGRSV